MSDVHLLISPEAGRGRAAKAAETVLSTIRAEGHSPIDLTAPTAEASAETARAAVDGGASRLIVVGGDGLVHLALQAVAESETVLGIVPVGTGNDFARGLDTIPDNPEAATRVALGEGQPLDVIRADDRWVASVATAGFSGDVNDRANRLRFPRGASRYTVATIAELPTLQTRDVRLTVDGTIHDFRSALFAVANTGWFGGGMHIAPEANPTDGLLDITVVADVGRFELLRFFRLVFSGRHMSHPDVHALRGKKVEIQADSLDVWGDGEPIGAAPVALEAVIGGVRLAR